MARHHTATEPLDCFHPLVAQWFRARYETPTAIQHQAWRQIQAGRHVLVTAPTGSGKTLTAFLWAMDQLISGTLSTDHTRVLYVSPLKALNNDIRRNLLQPLEELDTVFRRAGTAMPQIRVLTRSGDTPFTERRQMLRRPPEILITTPESLNLLLTSPQARTILNTVKTLILDEIHAVFAGKRGTYLMTAVERLVLQAGEFQRIALSATVNPLDTVARFVGGYRLQGALPAIEYVQRPVEIISSPTAKQYDLRVRYPRQAAKRPGRESIWQPLVTAFKSKISQNRSTLVFVNNRRLCEKIALKLNQQEAEPLAYAHHGSLAREIRQSVEAHLKAGRLKAIVATNSLELGIDIGPLDEVLLVQSPPSLAAAIQRIGRAGHQVGQISRASIYPTHARDFLAAAVLAQAVPEQTIAPQKPVQAPLDVLAQVIVAMTGVDTWNVDELYGHIRTCHAYRHLSRKQFDLVLQMLAGKYALSRVRDLKPRVALDAVRNTVKARKGALMAVYLSGGVIPDRGYYHLRHAQTGARIGDLDEEFVWEAKVGQTFNLGAQKWRIEKITAGEVLVVPGHPSALETPFWRGEAFQRDWHFSEKILTFLQEADHSLTDTAWQRQVRARCCLDALAAEELFAFLKRQKAALNNTLPHRRHVVVEMVHSAPGAAPGNQVIWLTLWGGQVNQPLALALDAAWHAKYGQRLEIFAGNDAIALLLPHDVPAEEILTLVNSGNLDQLLRARLETSGIFGARFRECAGRALLLTRRDFKKRMPLWMSRLRSQKLFNAVRQYDDFPILLETWRTCLQDEFDLASLRRLLGELETGAITWSAVHAAQPSPLARQMAWNQINTYMYRDDTPQDDQASRLSSDLWHEIVHSPALRPSVSRPTVVQFEAKSLRLVAGYAPGDGDELVEWVKERVLIPAAEWQALGDIIGQAHDRPFTALTAAVAPRLTRLRLSQASADLVVARELLPPVCEALSQASVAIQILPLLTVTDTPEPAPDLSDTLAGQVNLAWLLGEWLQFYGPVRIDFITRTLGVAAPRAAAALDQLVDDRQLIGGKLIKGENDTVYCDARNFEMLLRLERRAAQPVIEPLPCEALALFFATIQGLVPGDGDRQAPVERLLARIEQLSGYAMAAHLWESDILPARMPDYDPAWLDSLLQTTDLKWLGRAKRHVMFCFEPDLDLLLPDTPVAPETRQATVPAPSDAAVDNVLSSAGRFDFSTLLRLTGLSPAEITATLWRGVWQGDYSNDSFAALRQGLANRFQPPQAAGRTGVRLRRGIARSAFSRWKAALPQAGNWFKVSPPELADDLLTQQERRKDRIRLLLNRYGVLFRELLTRELPAFRWADLLRTLRLMDLSGEIHSGCFFQGIAGLQFIAPSALARLTRPAAAPPLFWLNALDPASLCGLGLAPLKEQLPPRIDSNHLVYRGAELMVTSRRRGRHIVFHIPPDDPDLGACLAFLYHLLDRAAQPQRQLTIMSINDRPSNESPYLPVFMDAFDVVRDPRSITLYKRIA